MSKSKMTKCKVCGAEIAKSAKTCPSCGNKNKKKNSVLLGLIFIILGFVIVISSTSGNEEPVKVDSTNTNQSETTTTKQSESKNKFTVGETAELKGVSVKLVDVTENMGSQFNEPTEGNVFVICEFEIENNSDKEIAVSSMLSFEAYCDDYTCTFSLSALIESDKNQLDGKVAPGKKFNGVIGYEVPSDWEELEVRFMPDFWSGNDIVFIADK